MKRTENSPVENHGRYIASAELADLRGVSAVPVAYRAAALIDRAKRDFIWWLQGESLMEGGFRRLARELLGMFPERIGTKAMHQAEVQPGKMYPAGLRPLKMADRHLHRLEKNELEKFSGDELIAQCRSLALTYQARHSESEASLTPIRELSIEQFLVDLCINPKVKFALCQNDSESNPSELETEFTVESDPRLTIHDFVAAELFYFQDIIGALEEYRNRKLAALREKFFVTEIGRQIWCTLDFAINTRNMVLVYGREGRGKTEAVKAWAQLHSGRARLVSLKGIATKTAAFREIALALGITASYNLTGSQLQSKIEDVLKLSGLMLVIDEAHFLFNQSQSTKARPELIDWLDTAMANRHLPVALCSTPQFMDCMARAAYQVHWNYNQFRRRCKRWVSLPEENTEADIMGVAGSVFAGANAAVIKKVASYVFTSGRDLSALGDVATELRAALGHSDLSKATFKLVDQVIRENLFPSDTVFAVEMERAEKRIRKGRKLPRPVLPDYPELDQIAPDQPAPIGCRTAPIQSEPTESPQFDGADAGRNRMGTPARHNVIRRDNINELAPA
jgi:energy-coupling factor transporter ATP-binding protein EcfA2